MLPEHKEIKISVIIPTYNRANTIEACIHSILNQSYLPSEIIVVDDASTDNTVEVVQSIKNDLIKIVRINENNGAQNARNRGIIRAKNEWIAFLDSDDTWLPRKLEKQVTLINEYYKHYPLIVVQANCIRTTEESTVEWKLNTYSSIDIYKELLIKPGPMFQGLITTKIALEKIDYLDESIIAYQEWDTSIRLSKYCKYFWVDEPLFNYNLDKNSSNFRTAEKTILGYTQILKKNKLTIIKIWGKSVYSNKLLTLIIQSINEENKELGYTIFVGNKPDFTVTDKLKFKLVYKYGVSTHSLRVFERFLNSPMNETKHILKKFVMGN